jgi:hypothetical protein
MKELCRFTAMNLLEREIVSSFMLFTQLPQRRKVWSPRGKSFLIDSIVRGMPLPQFFIREIVLLREKRTVREVVDGRP